MATFPDQLTDYLQAAIDKFSFTIGEALDDSELGIDINGGTGAFVVPCIINLEDELIHIESKTSTTLTASASGRGYGGTTAATHTDGTFGYLPFTAEHYTEMVVGWMAALKYLCRTEATLPATGNETEYELCEYNDEIYVYNGSSWERLGLVFSHDSWKDLDAGDPHPVYHTASRLDSAHDALAGDHVTGGDTHDHLDGIGFGLISSDTDRILSAPTYDGEVVLDTTTGVLYVSYIIDTPDVTDWIEVTGAPAGLIMPFDPANLSGSCPSGWSRYTILDEKFIKGTTGSSQGSGGSSSHSHTYNVTDIITHSHAIAAQVVNPSSTDGDHTHSWRAGGGSHYDGAWEEYGGSGGSYELSSGGGHAHTGVMSNNTESVGSATPATDFVSGEPPYKKVIWCQKD